MHVTALKAFDMQIDVIWVSWGCACGCILRRTFTCIVALLGITGKSKDLSQDLQKSILDLYKSGLSLGANSLLMKVPRLSVQTIERK